MTKPAASSTACPPAAPQPPMTPSITCTGTHGAPPTSSGGGQGEDRWVLGPEVDHGAQRHEEHAQGHDQPARVQQVALDHPEDRVHNNMTEISLRFYMWLRSITLRRPPDRSVGAVSSTSARVS